MSQLPLFGSRDPAMRLHKITSIVLAATLLAGAAAEAAPVSPNAQARDYPAPLYKGALHQPDFKGRDRGFASYRTRLRDGIKAGPNFAGHMALIVFGCGTGCKGALVADIRTGKVFSFPLGGEENLYLYLAYDKASNLVTADWVKDNRCLEQKLVWDGSGFTSSTTTDIGDQAVCDKLWEK